MQVILGVVVDKRTLNKLGLAVVSGFATVIPIVLALQPDQPELAGHFSKVQCALSEAETARVRAAMVGFNASCDFNMSLSSIIV